TSPLRSTKPISMATATASRPSASIFARDDRGWRAKAARSISTIATTTCSNSIPAPSSSASPATPAAASRNQCRKKRAESHDSPLFPPRHGRHLVARNALPHLVRDRGPRHYRTRATGRGAEGSGGSDLGEGGRRDL